MFVCFIKWRVWKLVRNLFSSRTLVDNLCRFKVIASFFRIREISVKRWDESETKRIDYGCSDKIPDTHDAAERCKCFRFYSTALVVHRLKIFKKNSVENGQLNRQLSIDLTYIWKQRKRWIMWWFVNCLSMDVRSPQKKTLSITRSHRRNLATLAGWIYSSNFHSQMTSFANFPFKTSKQLVFCSQLNSARPITKWTE